MLYFFKLRGGENVFDTHFPILTWYHVCNKYINVYVYSTENLILWNRKVNLIHVIWIEKSFSKEEKDYNSNMTIVDVPIPTLFGWFTSFILSSSLLLFTTKMRTMARIKIMLKNSSSQKFRQLSQDWYWSCLVCQNKGAIIQVNTILVGFRFDTGFWLTFGFWIQTWS